MIKITDNSKIRSLAHRTKLLTLALVAVGVVGVATLQSNTATAASNSYISAKNYYNTLIPALSDDMSSASVTSSNWYTNPGKLSTTNSGRQALYNPSGVTTSAVKNGTLAVIAQRHCVANSSVAVSQSNVSADKCAKTTKYSAGRLESKKLITGTFLIEIRAKMPSNPAYGIRSALWMVNVPSDGSPAYCGASTPQTNLSEFDILEWYSDSKKKINRPTSSTHILCNYNAKTKKSSYHSSTDLAYYSSSWYKKWHIFSLRYNGSSTQYFIDGKLTHEVKDTDLSSKKQKAEWNTAPTQQQWAQATDNTQWRVILQEEVFSRAKNSKAFPAQTTLIDYVHVYKHV